MYAVIRTGGKQYKVKAGDVLKVEKLEMKLGEEFKLEDVLFLSGETSHIGEPFVKSAAVTFVVTKQSKAPKVIVFKKKRRQGYRRLNGHRQPFTELFVKEIVGPNGEKETSSVKAQVFDPAAQAEKKAARKAETKKAAKSAPKKAAAKKTAKKTKAKKKTTKKKTAKKKTTKKATKKKS